jgi:tRNA G18 (ribose-2'-O)-methylase SpoU
MQVPTTAAGIELVLQAGYNLYLATIEGASITQTEVQKPLCLVIGNEGDGIAKRHHPRGEQISLPQSASDISYNASVAAGILMFLIANAKNSKA